MTEQQTPQPIRQLSDATTDDGTLFVVFAVLQEVREGITRKGKGDPFLDIRLADCSGAMRGKIWSNAGPALATARKLQTGNVVKALFQVETYKGAAQLVIHNLRAVEPDDQYDAELIFGEGSEIVRDISYARVVFDIETVPAFDRRSLSKTVAESVARHAERTDSDEAKVMGLSPYFGKVVSLAVGDGDVAAQDQQVTVLVVPPDGHDGDDFPEWIRPVSEPDLLRAWWALAANAETVISFNGRGFDVPFLVARSLIHNIPARRDLLSNRFSLRPHLDLYRAITWGERALGPANLDVVCWALGIESPKEQMDGSMVAPAYGRGEIATIAEYNAHDVRATTAVYHRVREMVLRYRDDW